MAFSTGHCAISKERGEAPGDTAVWWRGAPTGECCGTEPLGEVNFQIYYKSKTKHTFCPLMWLLEQCCSWSSWWNSRSWVCGWRQQVSLRWLTVQGHVWTEVSNANVDTAERERKLRWTRAFNRYEVTGTQLESVLLCMVPLLPAPSTSCSGADNGHPHTRQGT